MRKFLTVLHVVALAVACLSVPIAIFIAVRFIPVPLANVPNVTNADLMTTLLTGLALVLGVLAIVIAGLAIWGYGAIKSEAKDIATRQAKTAADEYLRSIDMEERIRGLVRPIIEDEVAKIREGIALSYSQPPPKPSTIPPEESEETKKVGKPYPDKEGG